MDSSSFDCKCCGHCCEGTGGILVSPEDLARLCHHLSVSALEFEDSYGERAHGKLRVRTGADGYCIFFIEGTGCSVHTSKPDVCRAWPFFRGNLVDPVSLELAKGYCPGIPPEVSFDDFVQEGIQYLKEARLVRESGYAHALNMHGIVKFKK